ncbi:hypothetical protein ACLB2K_009062 [Fragaria x ananassa]
MAMAMTIGDESCRGQPIYVRVACSAKYKPQNCWYVIKEKPDEALFITSDEEGNNDDKKGSHIYLIGGDTHTTMKNEDEENIGYKHFELGQTPQWVLGGGKLLHAQFGAATVGHDGFIYSVGCNQYRLSPNTGILKQLPVPAFLIPKSNHAPYQLFRLDF